MADRKPVTLDDLSREELLRFTRSRLWGWTEPDLVRAQWEVAVAAAQRAGKEVIEFSDRVILAATVVDRAMKALGQSKRLQNPKEAERALQKLDAAHADYTRLRDERDKLEATAERLNRRADRLYRQYEAVSR